MTDPADQYPWLPLPTVMAWLKLADDSDKATNVETCRRGAADWIQDQRKDLFVTDPDTLATTFAPTDRIVSGALLAVARLFARVDSPNGVVAFDELGAGSILAKDPDVARYIGRRRPVLG